MPTPNTGEWRLGSFVGPMNRAQKLTVAALVVAALVLGVMVEIRSAFLTVPRTDARCYFRAAWAVRAGVDPYSVTEDHGWHYNYPPFLAILIGPFADAPPHTPQLPYSLPYPVAVAVWYVLSLAALWIAVHLLATILTRELHRPIVPFEVEWWSIRLVPLCAMLPAIGRTLSRGQVNLFVLALLAGWLWGIRSGRRFLGGMLLAFAICIKIIPAFLLLHPLWRRDGRTLAGCATGLLVGLVLLPVAAFGPEKALEYSHTLANVILKPGLGAGADDTRHEELTGAGTDSQAVQNVLHNWRHLDPATRPAKVDGWARTTHLAFAAAATLAVLLIVGRREPATARGECLFAGALGWAMTMVSPVCHPHYFAFLLPLAMGLWAGRQPRWLVAVLALHLGLNLLALFEYSWARDLGLTTVAAIGLGAAALMAPVERDTETRRHGDTETRPLAA